MFMKESVLIVDDDPSVCSGLSAALEERYSVECVQRGKDAIETFLKTYPRIVFVDYLLPDMKGLEVVRELKRIEPEVYIIFITAYGNMEVVIEALREGVFDYIDKPVHTEVLTASLRRLEADKMLRQARDQLKIERERRVLAFSLMHELSNSLAIISGNVQLLEKGILNHKKQTFRDVKTSLNDCTVMMQRLKEYVEIKPLSSILHSLDVNILLKAAVSSVSWNLMGRQGCEIVEDLKDVRKIKADPFELYEIFIDLIESTCKALKGEGRVTVSSSWEEDFVVIRISDTGPGMPEEMRKGLFRPLTTLGARGVGLFWANYLLGTYEGSMDVESAPGKGTTVSLRFPCEKEGV